jgi:hypothetical protein
MENLGTMLLVLFLKTVVIAVGIYAGVGLVVLAVLGVLQLRKPFKKKGEKSESKPRPQPVT